MAAAQALPTSAIATASLVSSSIRQLDTLYYGNTSWLRDIERNYTPSSCSHISSPSPKAAAPFIGTPVRATLAAPSLTLEPRLNIPIAPKSRVQADLVASVQPVKTSAHVPIKEKEKLVAVAPVRAPLARSNSRTKGVTATRPSVATVPAATAASTEIKLSSRKPAVPTFAHTSAPVPTVAAPAPTSVADTKAAPKLVRQESRGKKAQLHSNISKDRPAKPATKAAMTITCTETEQVVAVSHAPLVIRARSRKSLMRRSEKSAAVAPVAAVTSALLPAAPLPSEPVPLLIKARSRKSLLRRSVKGSAVAETIVTTAAVVPPTVIAQVPSASAAQPAPASSVSTSSSVADVPKSAAASKRKSVAVPQEKAPTGPKPLAHHFAAPTAAAAARQAAVAPSSQAPTAQPIRTPVPRVAAVAAPAPKAPVSLLPPSQQIAKKSVPQAPAPTSVSIITSLPVAVAVAASAATVTSPRQSIISPRAHQQVHASSIVSAPVVAPVPAPQPVRQAPVPTVVLHTQPPVAPTPAPVAADSYLSSSAEVSLSASQLAPLLRHPSKTSSLRRRSIAPRQIHRRSLAGMDKEVNDRMLARYSLPTERAVLQWISAMLEEKLPTLDAVLADASKYTRPILGDALHDGQYLCRLANKLRPGVVSRYNERRVPLYDRENIQLYLNACARMGLLRQDLFIVSDLYEEKSISAVLTNLMALGRRFSHVKPSLVLPNAETLSLDNLINEPGQSAAALAADEARRIAFEEKQAAQQQLQIAQSTAAVVEASHKRKDSPVTNYVPAARRRSDEKENNKIPVVKVPATAPTPVCTLKSHLLTNGLTAASASSNRLTIVKSDDGAKLGLLQWARKRIAQFDSTINVSNFTTDWQDGRAFCGLLGSLCPSHFVLRAEQVTSADVAARLRAAFATSNALGVPQLVDDSDFGFERLSMMTYLSEFHTLDGAKKGW